jgi:hypothetical protein
MDPYYCELFLDNHVKYENNECKELVDYDMVT